MPLNVVALVSGGKDSCYSILKCRSYGHNVLALAHITPPTGKEEADSYMYQSVASSTIPYLAQALSLPLVTAPTTAVALTTSLSYTPTPNDEVEDLVQLLRQVKSQFPVTAVCAGALWSDYQRLRVESAAARVGLLSLAYLWRREQSALLDEMVAVGVQAVLVKVAGVGLDDSLLGKSLAEVRPTLRKLEKLYGSHVCGEGGEYESLVLWMPGFSKRVVLQQVQTVLHSPDHVAPVSFLKVLKCALAELTEQQKSMSVATIPNMPWSFSDGLHAVQEKATQEEALIDTAFDNFERSEISSVAHSKDFMHISLASPHGGKRGVAESAKRLKVILESHNENLGSVLYVLLYLNSVSGEKYVDANRGYNEVFAVPECTPPPSRACVGNSRTDHPTVMEAIVRKRRDKSHPNSFTLHVQSLSEWAPPCIGPYAQFVEDDGMIHVCGVLPLYAPLASIPDGMSARSQVRACVHNLERTLEASRSKLGKLGIFIAYVTAPSLVEDVRDEMRQLLAHELSQIVILPVSGLPKGALVEIRSVGVVDDQDLSLVACNMDDVRALGMRGMKIDGTVCGKLGFLAMTFSARDDDMLMECKLVEEAMTTMLVEVQSPLSLQLYLKGTGRDDIRNELLQRYPSTAVSVFNSTWLPDRATFICLATWQV